MPSRSIASAVARWRLTNVSRSTEPAPPPTTTTLFVIAGWASAKFSATLAPIEQPAMWAWPMPSRRRSWCTSSISVSWEYAFASFGTSDGG